MVADQSFLTVGSAAVALDRWRSKNRDSFVRARVGPAAEVEMTNKSASLKPFATVEADFTLDRDGFHHFTALASGEKLLFDAPLPGRTGSPQRLRLQAGYEVIVLAINDYPLTLAFDARATWRDDLVSVRPGWEFGLNAGLRFSFWAPARRDAGQVELR
jgi:hypothetical protein